MSAKQSGLLLSVAVCAALAVVAVPADAKSKKRARTVAVPAAPMAVSPGTLPPVGVIPDHGHGPGGGGTSDGVVTRGEGGVTGPPDVLVIWGPESADLGPSRRPTVLEQFERIDSNGDGVLSRSELEAHFAALETRVRESMQDRFDAADVDGSGSLDLAELQVAMPCLAESFSRLDTDGDGYLELDELPIPNMGD